MICSHAFQAVCDVSGSGSAHELGNVHLPGVWVRLVFSQSSNSHNDIQENVIASLSIIFQSPGVMCLGKFLFFVYMRTSGWPDGQVRLTSLRYVTQEVVATELRYFRDVVRLFYNTHFRNCL
jgi:hypothetical protein